MKSKGFTLIELLVVIAIIGILSSVVLASLNSARTKGADTAVKVGLNQVSTQAEVYYDGTGAGSYGASSVCTLGSETGVFADTVIKAQMVQIRTQLTGAAITCSTTANGQKWAVSAATLKGLGGTWCVDNSGWNKAGTSATGVCS